MRVLDGEQMGDETRPIAYCLVPRDLASRLHEVLRKHFVDDPSIEVIVEFRAAERRRTNDRRQSTGARAQAGERRRIRGVGGRRAGERRAALLAGEARALPRRARGHADRLTFVERLEPTAQQAEDLDTARLVTRIQSGEDERFSDLYMRYFDRVYTYLRLLLKDRHTAEDAAQQVFMNVHQALPRYERRRQPFRAWLFVIVRNHALNEIKGRQRLEPTDPRRLDRLREQADDSAEVTEALAWISDRDLVMLVERLPLAQRQVLLMHYMLALSTAQIAQALDRKPEQVKVLHYRALQFLRQRLSALGRSPDNLGRAGTYRRFRQAGVLRARRVALTR